MTRRCEWHRGQRDECTRPATLLQWDPELRPVGLDFGNPYRWSTEHVPRFPDDYTDSIDALCHEHARLSVYDMANRYRDYTLEHLHKTNVEIASIIDASYTLGSISPHDAMRLAELYERHAELVKLALQFLSSLQGENHVS